MGQLVQRALRGRWGRTIVLALAGAVLGGWAGWKSQEPTYRSEGMIRIAYALPSVLTPTDVTAPIQSYDVFMQSMRSLIMNRRVVELAMRKPAWQASGRGASPAAVEKFVESLKVEQVPRTEHLKVMFEDKDPAVSAAGVRSVIGAFEEVYSSQDSQLQTHRLRTLEDEQAKLRNQLNETQRLMEEAAGELGPANLEVVYTAAVQKTIKLESQLGDIRMAKALARKEQVAPGQAQSALTVKQIAMVDGTMRAYLLEREEAEQRLAQLGLNLGESHAQVRAARAALEAAEQRVRQYAVDYAEFQKTFGRALQGGQNPNMALIGRSIVDLEAEEAVVAAEYDQAKAKMAALGEKRQAIVRLEQQAKGIQDEMAKASKRLDDLRVESSMGGRLHIVHNGEVPIAPYIDKRYRMSAMGAAVGMMVPAGLVLLLGLASRRYRYSDETRDDIARSAPLLGILPRLPSRLGGGEQAASAAHCVHQMRAMLQVGKAFAGQRTFMITSSTSGEGKTSVAVALGIAFAASGSRTLVIDGDLIGQRLSRGFKMEQLPGLREAFDRVPLDRCVRTMTGGMAVLPVGNSGMLHACSMTAGSIRDVLTAARAAYDVILIDTGPVLGSVEAMVMAPEVDGVLFTVARGQERPLVDRALQQLTVVGAKVAGFIFNLAEPRDWRRSSHGSSFSSAGGEGQIVVRRSRPEDEAANFGPLVRAVTSFLPNLN